MELAQLKYFCAVAKRENITAAAKELYISQPTLSQTIARIESSVGTPLFSREKGKIHLNASGKAFLRHAEAALFEVENAIMAARENSEFGATEIFVASSAGNLLSQISTDFLANTAGLRIRELFLPDVRINAMLNEMSLDFALSIDPPVFENTEWVPLISEPLYFLLSPTHPLANTGALALHQMAQEKFLCFDSGLDRNYTKYLCNNLGGFSPNTRMISNEAASVLSAVASNIGITLVFAHDLRYLMALQAVPNLCFAKLVCPDYQCSVGILKRTGRPISGVLKQFMDFTIQHLNQFAETIPQIPESGYVGELIFKESIGSSTTI